MFLSELASSTACWNLSSSSLTQWHLNTLRHAEILFFGRNPSFTLRGEVRPAETPKLTGESFSTQRYQRNCPKRLILTAKMNPSTVLVDLPRLQRFSAHASSDISAVVCVHGCCHGLKIHINLALLLKVSKIQERALFKAPFLWSIATTGFPWDNDHAGKMSRTGTAKGNIPALLFKMGKDKHLFSHAKNDYRFNVAPCGTEDERDFSPVPILQQHSCEHEDLQLRNHSWPLHEKV